MRPIKPELTDELTKYFGDNSKVGVSDAYKVETFRELVEHIAKLSYKNKDYCLFFRGQNGDYRNKSGSSTFYPSIYRGDYMPLREITKRFEVLDGASKKLSELFENREIEGYKDLKRRRAIQWSILQHYEVCSTPYLDFTQSLRVACSFAIMDNQNDTAFVFAFGLPYLTNRISINSEQDIVNIRLLSICPPTAYRPYFQEGYLAGTDDITDNFDKKNELDFSNRLIAKFEIPTNKAFWGQNFHQIPKDSLYPDNDPIFELCQEIKWLAARDLKSGDVGDFLKSWSELEARILMLADNTIQRKSARSLTIREAIKVLMENRLINQNAFAQLDNLRDFRNRLVHHTSEVSQKEIDVFIKSLNNIKKTSIFDIYNAI